MLHALRTSTLLARLVMVWFVLALGVAIASPIVHPQSMEVVCSAGGAMKLVATGEDGQAATSMHTLDCALCLVTGAPGPRAVSPPHMPQPLAHALRPIAAAHIAALVGAPLPPRGPPHFV